MFNDFGCHAARFADFSISGIVFELEREQFAREGIEIFVAADVRRP